MEVRSWSEDRCTVVQVRGELDVSSAPRLNAALEQVWSGTAPPHVVIDLTGVPFCDSVGLGELVAAHNRARQASGRLVLVLEPGMITHLLTITNLDRHFETSPSVDAARAALTAAA
ncbi:STAS domain-containing protein [Nonomuraea typhae]|uniref:Anti-sigma factor antagonist n=1 Tax=Nonomuraea typhae TaxID=2603600 RepID=A0ABW7Z002_9ACTN